MQVDMTYDGAPVPQYVSVNGGLLVQQLDTQVEEVTPAMCVTAVKPTPEQMSGLNFGWKIVKHVKSNAIAVVKGGHTVGVGAGQTNRVGSALIALEEAKAAGFTEDLILASDGFLPFDDTVALAAKYGVTAIVQPGGSIRDADAIAKADELGITMLFTGVRHFKH
jgi:phosphoribosylaminoimidazolecarboxamide formyltransferase/IMP cyclohydrolase